MAFHAPGHGQEGFLDIGDPGESILQTCDRCGERFALKQIDEHRRACKKNGDYCCESCGKCPFASRCSSIFIDLHSIFMAFRWISMGTEASGGKRTC